jgi:hypothetical protein
MTQRLLELLGRVSAAPGCSDPATSELRDRLPCHGGIAAVEREIVKEIAYSLGKAASKLEAALEQASRTHSALESAALDTAERQLLRARFREQRAHAERRLRDLMIQREALGFRHHTDLLKLYPLPPRLPEP